MDQITKEKLEKYFNITEEALKKAKSAPKDSHMLSHAEDFLDMSEMRGISEHAQKPLDHCHCRYCLANVVFDMAQRYFDDARHFEKKGDSVTAFAALNYAHGWLDAGARIGLFKVNDSRLFTVDDE